MLPKTSHLGFGAKDAAGDPQPQMFKLGFGAKDAAGDPQPQMFKLGRRARMAELADALDSGSSGVTPVKVQVLFLALEVFL